MLRFGGGLLAVLFALSACATVARGPRLSHADVRRIADAEIRRTMKIDLHQYEISALRYVSTDDYWSVVYHLKGSKRASFTVRVSDKMQKASIDQSDGGIFEGVLTPKPDLH